MKRQFTARQLSISLLILRLSWGCNREYCVMPFLRDFEICGIHRSDITIELTRLHKQKVIFWDPEYNQFAFNKDFDQWSVSLSLPSVSRESRFDELLSINLHTPFTPVGILPTFLLVDHQQAVGKSPTPLATNSATPKERVKERRYKESSGEAPNEKGKNYGEFCTIYESNIGILAPIVAQDLDLLCTEFSLEWFGEAVKEAVRQNKRSLKYVTAILDRWGREGYKAPVGRKTGMPPGRPPGKVLPTAAELQEGWKL